MVFSSRSLVPFNYGDLIKTTSKKTLQNGANCAIGKNPPPHNFHGKKKTHERKCRGLRFFSLRKLRDLTQDIFSM